MERDASFSGVIGKAKRILLVSSCEGKIPSWLGVASVERPFLALTALFGAPATSVSV
jgi:hypothetical protein